MSSTIEERTDTFRGNAIQAADPDADFHIVTGVTASDPAARAGESAQREAEQASLFIESTQRQIASLQETLRDLRRRQAHFLQGAVGERRMAERVLEVLVDLDACDWRLLVDRRWPGTRRANIDLILVGPAGVFVLDAKNWSEPRLAAGSLWCGQINADDEIDGVRRMAEAVSDVLAGVGLPPVMVRPIIVLSGKTVPGVEVQGVLVVGENNLQRELVRRRGQLSGEHVATLVAALDHQCPPAVSPHVPRHRRPQPQDNMLVTTGATGSQQALLQEQEIWTAAVEAAALEPIEAWMSWLHPAQAQLVSRRYGGPARVRGAAGTGKTVVALHRARHLARRPGARVLVTSFVRTLPIVQQSLFRRLAPDSLERVEFVGLHAWATRLLRDRRQHLTIAPYGGKNLLAQAWVRVGKNTALAELRVPRDYWWDEVQTVIKGRGLRSAEQYVNLNRISRRTPLRTEQRLLVWRLYEEYERLLHGSRQHDFSDVLLLALESVRETPLQPPYTAIVVDEVQDLTCVGLMLLSALVGDAPDGLFLVGDGQQSVYPGGFTLAEAGVSVQGRGAVLERNYRNAREVLTAALAIVSSDVFDDLEPDPVPGSRQVEIDRAGGTVLTAECRDQYSQQVALLSALRASMASGMRSGDMAVLCARNSTAASWLKILSDAGVNAALLKDYDGTTSDAVKVGTYQRSKGLEFARVFLPDFDHAVAPKGIGEAHETYLERAELERRQLFVAMTRARDGLWLGTRRPLPR